MNVTNYCSGRRDFPLDLAGDGLPDWETPLPLLRPLRLEFIGYRLDAGVTPEYVDIQIRGGIELAAWIGTITHETRSASAALQAEWQIDVDLVTADGERTPLVTHDAVRSSPYRGAESAYWSKSTNGQPASKLNTLRKRFYPFTASATFDNVERFEQDYRIEASVRARAATKSRPTGMINCNPTAYGVFVDAGVNHRRNSDPIDLFPATTSRSLRSAAVYAFDTQTNHATNFDDLLETLSRWDRG